MSTEGPYQTESIWGDLPRPQALDTLRENEQATKKDVNPCIALYGPGPDEQTCKGCVHLRYPIVRNPKARFWKCDLRKLSHGSKTDHRVNWQSCGRYEQRREEYHGG